MARTISGPKGALSGGTADTILLANTGGGEDGALVMQVLYTKTDTFIVTSAMDEVTFLGVGGGGAGAAGFGGGGAGFFQKTFRVGTDVSVDTAFKLTIGAATGTTFLRDAANTVICQATGGTNATASAHGRGGTASGGDINSNGAPGTPISAYATTSGGAYGGAAGSPFGHSIGPDMYLLPEYANAYVRQVRADWLKSGSSIPRELGEAFNDGIPGNETHPSGWPGNFGGNGGSSNLPNGAGGDGGFGGAGGSGTTMYPISGKGGFGYRGGTGGQGGFGAAGGVGKEVLRNETNSGGVGGCGGFGGGGGPGGGFNGSTALVKGGTGGPGGYGGGGGGGFKQHSTSSAVPGAGGLGGSGAILVLVKTRDALARAHV